MRPGTLFPPLYEPTNRPINISLHCFESGTRGKGCCRDAGYHFAVFCGASTTPALLNTMCSRCTLSTLPGSIWKPLSNYCHENLPITSNPTGAGERRDTKNPVVLHCRLSNSTLPAFWRRKSHLHAAATASSHRPHPGQNSTCSQLIGEGKPFAFHSRWPT